MFSRQWDYDQIISDVIGTSNTMEDRSARGPNNFSVAAPAPAPRPVPSVPVAPPPIAKPAPIPTFKREYLPIVPVQQQQPSQTPFSPTPIAPAFSPPQPATRPAESGGQQETSPLRNAFEGQMSNTSRRNLDRKF